MCPRCGADLTPLMGLAVRAWRLRQSAREALATGDLEAAMRLVGEAESLRSTRAGHALKSVLAWVHMRVRAAPKMATCELSPSSLPPLPSSELKSII